MADKEKMYEDFRAFFEGELHKITKAGDLTDKTLEASYKLIDIIKDIDEVCKYDMEMGYDSMDSGRGYGRGRSMGYPYYAGASYEGRGSYGYGPGRSYNTRGSRNSAIDHLQTMVDNAQNDNERQMYQRWLDEAQRTF